MRRISRLERSIDLLRTRTPTQTTPHYLCSACKHRTTPFSTSATHAARAKVPFTEKLRKKIWGTDSPPGQADPYGNASVFDKTKNRDNEDVEERNAANQNGSYQNQNKQRKKAVVDNSYEEASTWNGLKVVGGFEEWWKTNWDPHHQFVGFLPRRVMKDNEEISVALHRAIVEAMALQQVGVPLDAISAAAPRDDLTQEIQVSLSSTGSATLQFPDSVTLHDIVQSLAPVEPAAEAPTESQEDLEADKSEEDPLHPEEVPEKQNRTESEEDVAADRSNEDPLEDISSGTNQNAKMPRTYYDAVVKSWDPAWLQTPLDDPVLKFAVIKRTMQLTGIRFPDSAINSTKDAKSLLSHLVKPPKPRKLAQALQEKEQLVSLPNVQVFSQRVTPVHKEKSVGRWKVIQEELQERGLPVIGKS